MKFYQLPQELLHDEAFNGLDGWAIILYSVMLDRKKLSEVNSTDFSDKDGRIYIIFTIQEVMKLCRCAEKYAVKMLSQLEKSGLIEKRKQGQGKPNIIYVNELSTATASELSKRQSLNCLKDNSKTVPKTTQELSKRQPSNTNSSNTDFNNTNNIYNAACGKVNELSTATGSEVQILNFKKSNKYTSKGSKNELQEVQNLNPSNTNSSNTDFNNTNNIYNAACGKVDFDIKAFFSDVVRYEREKKNKAGDGDDV